MLEQHIKKLRKRNALTQSNLADLIGFKQPTISRLEKNCSRAS
jgi:DNA-binding XRE family transcriptional regulator